MPHSDLGLHCLPMSNNGTLGLYGLKLTLTGPVVSEENTFKECGHRCSKDNVQLRPTYPVSSPISLRLR